VRIEVIFVTHDSIDLFFANHRRKINCRIIMADCETAQICREIKRMHERFGECPFIPQTYADLKGVPEFPIFLNPNIGEDSKNTRWLEPLRKLHMLLDCSQIC
jgi:hypothetical protein